MGYGTDTLFHCRLFTLFEVLQAHCVERGKPYVITPPQWGVLTLLFRHDGHTISTLAQQLGVDGPAVTNIVKRLEQSDLVKRVRDRKDERVVRVLLTDEGKDIFCSLEPLVLQFHEHLLPGDQRQLFLKASSH